MSTPNPDARLREAALGIESGANPLLATCPPRQRKRYSRTAQEALAGRYRAAVKIKCLECVAWEYSEAKRCVIRGCGLHALNRRIFRPGERSG